MSSIKKRMFSVAKDTADIGSKYYAVVKKVPAKKKELDTKITKVPLKLPGRKPTKVYRRADSKRLSAGGNYLLLQLIYQHLDMENIV